MEGEKKISVYELDLDMRICSDKTLGTDLESLSKASVLSSHSKLHLALYVHRARSFSELAEGMWRNGKKKSALPSYVGNQCLRASSKPFNSGFPVEPSHQVPQW